MTGKVVSEWKTGSDWGWRSCRPHPCWNRSSEAPSAEANGWGTKQTLRDMEAETCQGRVLFHSIYLMSTCLSIYHWYS